MNKNESIYRLFSAGVDDNKFEEFMADIIDRLGGLASICQYCPFTAECEEYFDQNNIDLIETEACFEVLRSQLK